MKIMLLTRLDDVGWDENEGFVIIASSEDEARKMANSEYACEGKIWESPDMVNCTVVGEGDGPARIVLTSFNAG